MGGNGHPNERLGGTLEGTARLTHELATRISDLGHTVVAITTGPEGNISKTQRNYRLKTLGDSFSFRKLSGLRNLVRGLRPDIIHFHGGELMSYFATLLGPEGPPKIFTFTFVPSVARLSNNLTHRSTLLILSKLRQFKMKRLAPFAHAIALSEFAREELERELPRVPVSVVRYGVAEQYLSPTQLRTDECGNDVICTSGLTTERGFDTFLSSIPIIEKKFRDVNFMATLREFKEKTSVPKTLRLLGPGAFIEMVRSRSIVLMPYSKHIAIDPPLSLVECMALGKTVISTSIGSIPEILGMNRGRVVHPRDPIALAHTTCELLENRSLRASIGRNAREFVTKQYDWNLALASIQRIYARASSGAAS